MKQIASSTAFRKDRSGACAAMDVILQEASLTREWDMYTANDIIPEEELCAHTLEACTRRAGAFGSGRGDDRCPFTFEHVSACFGKNSRRTGRS